jgi:5-methyltetrahydrofolate--homocysteine methyltransferase
MQNNQELFDAMVNLEEEKTCRIVENRVGAGVPVRTILSDLQRCLIEIGNRFEQGQYFVPELIYASEIMKRNLRFLNPYLTSESIEKANKVIMGTVYGDVHDIGKDIVVALLDGTGFEVIDLGVNVEPRAFVSAIKESDAQLVGISVLLTMCIEGLSTTIRAIRDAGYGEKVSVMIGGAPVTELVCEKVGADFYGRDAFEGVKIAQRIYGS